MARVKKYKKIYDPRVWPTWVIVGFGWLIARLPYRLLIPLSRAVGGLVYRLGRHRRGITLVNLTRCFPELDNLEIARLARESFTHTAIGALEAITVWLNPARDFAAKTRLHGLEHLTAARAPGKGVLLVGGHFSAMDVIGPKAAEVDIDVMYRRNKNPVWEWLQVRGRRRYFAGVIEREDTRTTLRRLQRGRAIWYAADQDYGKKHSVFADFFAIPTATVNATARLAAFNGSPVLFVSTFRDLETGTWDIHLSAPLAGFPGPDEVANATRINACIEAAVRQHPEQYLWMHRRFKTRPEGEGSFYRAGQPT